VLHGLMHARVLWPVLLRERRHERQRVRRWRAWLRI
jgi:hypothetical protein